MARVSESGLLSFQDFKLHGKGDFLIFQMNKGGSIDVTKVNQIFSLFSQLTNSFRSELEKSGNPLSMNFLKTHLVTPSRTSHIKQKKEVKDLN